MASASGLTLIPEHKRNPMFTTTYGTGELIAHALDNGCRKIIIAIGGSATVDGGAGMIQALGAEFFDELGKPMNEYITNKKLNRVADINLDSLHPEIKNAQFIIASDVDNPLLGDNGATYVYAPQKGARPFDLPILEDNLEHFYNLVEKKLNKEVRNLPEQEPQAVWERLLWRFYPLGWKTVLIWFWIY